MRRDLGLLIALLGLACNANPLLKNLTSNFTPLKAGSHWVFSAPDGTLRTRKVLDTGSYFGRQAYHLRDSFSDGSPDSDFYWAWGQAGAFDRYNSAQAEWQPYRKLPYVTGNHWALVTGVPTINIDVKVEATEDMRTPAGNFANCFRLKTKVQVYDTLNNVTATTESLLWSAPDVGDVRYASVDVSGTATTTLELGSYNLVP